MLRPRVSADPVFETGAANLYPPAFQKWSARQDLHLRSPGPKPGMLLLHHALFAPACLGAHRGLCFMGMAGPTHLEPVSRGKNRKLADPKGVAPSAFPQTTGCSAD